MKKYIYKHTHIYIRIIRTMIIPVGGALAGSEA